MVQHMKWWGWGDEQVSFTHEDKPDLAPFVREKLGIDLDGPRDSVIDFDELTIDPPVAERCVRRRARDRAARRSRSRRSRWSASSTRTARASAISCGSVGATSAACPT